MNGKNEKESRVCRLWFPLLSPLPSNFLEQWMRGNERNCVSAIVWSVWRIWSSVKEREISYSYNRHQNPIRLHTHTIHRENSSLRTSLLALSLITIYCLLFCPSMSAWYTHFSHLVCVNLDAKVCLSREWIELDSTRVVLFFFISWKSDSRFFFLSDDLNEKREKWDERGADITFLSSTPLSSVAENRLISIWIFLYSNILPTLSRVLFWKVVRIHVSYEKKRDSMLPLDLISSEF